MGLQYYCGGDHQPGGAAGCGSHPYHAEGFLQPPAAVPGGSRRGGPGRGCSPASLSPCKYTATMPRICTDNDTFKFKGLEVRSRFLSKLYSFNALYRSSIYISKVVCPNSAN